MLLKIVDQNHKDMAELIQSNLPLDKIIYGHEFTIQVNPRITTQYSFWKKWSDVMNFSQCEYSNCCVTTDTLEFRSAYVVLFTLKHYD